METEVTVSSSVSVVSSSATQTTISQATLASKQRDGRKPTATTPPFLSNLGRATLRGIRKCPQCGVYNGTRGLSCKNKACGISLRNASTKAGRKSKKCGLPSKTQQPLVSNINHRVIHSCVIFNSSLDFSSFDPPS